MSDSALVWITEYDFDGFRHDATKHIPMNFTRLLTQKIRAASEDHVYQIGETYGSDELIASYVGSGKVDAQFNFNLYDAAFEAFTQEGATFDRLRKALESSLTYYGHHHLMGNISGNQDKPRFSSMASGHLSMSEDSKLAGWTREIPGTYRARAIEKWPPCMPSTLQFLAFLSSTTATRLPSTGGTTRTTER
jgi:glycosidase